MRAVVYHRYGPPEVLRIEEVPRPSPQPDEILVRVRATTVNRADCATRDANRKSGPAVSLLGRLVSGLRAPRKRVLGSELAGEVAELGSAVADFSIGDRVFANTGFSFGAHAEFACVPESGRVARMPAGATFEEAAAVTDGFLNASWCLRLGEAGPGKKVLVYGASGAIGTAGVQLARHLGARVAAVCNTKNLELVRSLGADEVLDYTRGEDFTQTGELYDIVFDAVGKHSFKRSKGSLARGGRYLATDGFRNLVLAMWTSRFGDKKVIFKLPPRYTKQDVEVLKELMEAGSYRAVVDRTYLMDDVIEATKYVETEQKTGSVVMTVA